MSFWNLLGEIFLFRTLFDKNKPTHHSPSAYRSNIHDRYSETTHYGAHSDYFDNLHDDIDSYDIYEAYDNLDDHDDW